MEEIKAVIGTNSWGSPTYEKVIRGYYVSRDAIAETVDTALQNGLDVLDTADDYGFGEAQRLIGSLLMARNFHISAKYTPGTKYKSGQVHAAFEKECDAMNVNAVDYYWLHLPNNIEENLSEMIELYKEGRIRHIGISNFNLDEAEQARIFLAQRNVPLYGVQNHFSLLERSDEKSGLLDWCRENGIAYWAWAVLEEGILNGNTAKTKSVMRNLYQRKTKRLYPLFAKMKEIGGQYNLSIAETAAAYCHNKGTIPVCGCRKPFQAEQLAHATETAISSSAIKELEEAADQTGVKILKTDIFRFAVHH